MILDSLPMSNNLSMSNNLQQQKLTQQQAIARGRELAKQDRVELVTHRKDGTIRDSDSYGNDPNPPKDEKH